MTAKLLSKQSLEGGIGNLTHVTCLLQQQGLHSLPGVLPTQKNQTRISIPYNFQNKPFIFIAPTIPDLTCARALPSDRYIRKQVLLDGLTGKVAFDDNGDRINAEYQVININSRRQKNAVGKYAYSKVGADYVVVKRLRVIAR